MTSQQWSLRLSERKLLLATVDLLLVNLGMALALWIGAWRSLWEFDPDFLIGRIHWFFLGSVVYLFLAHANDGYDSKVSARHRDTLIMLLKTSLQMLLGYTVVYFFFPPTMLPRHVPFLFIAISLTLIAMWRAFYLRMLVGPSFRRRALVVGAGWAGQTIAKAAAEHLDGGYSFVGFIDDDPTKTGQVIEGMPVLGTRQEFPRIVQETGASEIIVAITHNMHGELMKTILDCYQKGIQITPMPLLYELATGRVPVEHMGDHWFVTLPDNPESGTFVYSGLKRLGDIVVSTIGLLIGSPILLTTALAVRLDSPGPIFYTQERMGKTGRVFPLIKFRTMIQEAEKDGRPRWASYNDPRVTRLGRFLRHTRLDELPQLVNVIKGEMSLVGPRPERPHFVAQLETQIPFYRARLFVRPGITGWAQINYSYGNSVEDALVKLQYDLYYIKHQSPYLDLFILFKTLGVMLTFKGT
ncbi:MAG: sugar transferase [Chloroflexi bacterium]|nr:sugar transferase [Chloroflexota bacterium]